MGFLKKKKPANEQIDDDAKVEAPKSKKAKDKSIKPKSPKRMSGKAFIRVIFWMFIVFIVIKGMVSFAQGTRVIQQVTNVGSNEPIITDAIKGFASDFATEYFTWSINDVNDRTERLKKFVSGIDADAGLKPYEVKGSSHVQSVEVYDTRKINESAFEITLNIRREVDLDSAPATAGSKEKKGKVLKQSYMVVPVLQTPSGLVITTYPRFVRNQPKGEFSTKDKGEFISDTDLISRATELTDSFLHSYFEGNMSQIKYFYENNNDAPSTLTKSDMSMEKVENISVYRMKGTDTTLSYLRIEASVLVKSDIGEVFTNQWILNVNEKNDRMYVISIGDQPASQDKESAPSQNPAPDQNNNTSSTEESTSIE